VILEHVNFRPLALRFGRLWLGLPGLTNVVLAEDNSMGECGLGSLRASYDIIVSGYEC
jgi:hypothetical protein